MIEYPYNLLVDFPGWSTEFDLLYRQEMSRTAGGTTIVKDMGTPLWRASFSTRALRPNELDTWRAKLKALEGGLKEFWGAPSSRCYPIAYPKGQGMGNVSAVTIASIGGDRKSVTLAGLPVGYKFSVGDYVQLGTRNLHQIVAADGAEIEFRPHIWPETKAGDAVTLVRPICKMMIVPGSLSSSAELATGRGTISFQTVESR